MSADDFLIDPLSYRILTFYILNYINFWRETPDVLDRLKLRIDEFEMVPIPKTLIQQLRIRPGLRPDWGGFDWPPARSSDGKSIDFFEFLSSDPLQGPSF